jgi:hypothetical protein
VTVCLQPGYATMGIPWRQAMVVVESAVREFHAGNRAVRTARLRSPSISASSPLQGAFLATASSASSRKLKRVYRAFLGGHGASTPSSSSSGVMVGEGTPLWDDFQRVIKAKALMDEGYTHVWPETKSLRARLKARAGRRNPAWAWLRGWGLWRGGDPHGDDPSPEDEHGGMRHRDPDLGLDLSAEDRWAVINPTLQAEHQAHEPPAVEAPAAPHHSEGSSRITHRVTSTLRPGREVEMRPVVPESRAVSEAPSAEERLPASPTSTAGGGFLHRRSRKTRKQVGHDPVAEQGGEGAGEEADVYVGFEVLEGSKGAVANVSNPLARKR